MYTLEQVQEIAKSLPPVRYEWGIRYKNDPEIHRSLMSETEARDWLRDVEEDDYFKPGVFKLIRRPLGDWEEVT